MTVTNEERQLPRMAFSAVLGIVQSMIPSGVSAIQELIGDSKELEKTTKMYYAFVWSTTFQTPMLFSGFVFSVAIQQYENINRSDCMLGKKY